MTNQQSAKLPEPGVRPLHDPATFVASQFTPIFIPPCPTIVTVRRDQLDAFSPQSLPQRIGIIGRISNQPFQFLPATTFRLRHTDFPDRGFRKRNFMRRGTFQPNSQRNTFTVDQYHPLCALATLGFPDCRAPFFAGAKLPSRKASSHFSKPSWSKAPNSARQACSQIPSSSHCCNRRQHVEGEGNSSGKKRQAAPVCRIHKMPSKQARFGAGGRPRLSLRRRGGGSNASTNVHCSSLNSLCRFFMTEAQQFNRLIHKYLV
jgi:hypothetical protein